MVKMQFTNDMVKCMLEIIKITLKVNGNELSVHTDCIMSHLVVRISVFRNTLQQHSHWESVSLRAISWHCWLASNSQSSFLLTLIAKT